MTDLAHPVSTAGPLLRPQQKWSAEGRRNTILTVALVTYVHLWILEGAFRKWVPGLDNVFYFARDGLFIAALVLAALVAPTAMRRGFGVLLWGSVFLLGAFGLLQVMAQDLPPLMAIVGLRGFIAPLLPLYAVIRYRPPNAWRRLSYTVLAYAPVEAVLTAIQVSSSRSAFINRQVGSEARFVTSGDIVRAMGTFSAPAGLTLFAGLCLAIALAFLAMPGERNLLPVVAVVSVVLIVLLSGSRSVIVTALITVAVFVIRQMSVGRTRGVLGIVALLAAAAVTLLVGALAFSRVVDAFVLRLTTASDAGNLDDRFRTTVFGFLSYPFTLFGDGLGAHSSSGVAVGSPFAWLEDENTRWVAELGVLGLIMVFVKFLLGAVIAVWLLAQFRRLPPLVLMTGVGVASTLLYGAATTQPSFQGMVGIASSIMASAYLDLQLMHRSDDYGRRGRHI